MPARSPVFVRQLERRVVEYIRQREVFRPGESIVVGVSGGPDSTALLLLLRSLRTDLRLRITAAHFDHRLRSREEANADREFVAGLCRRSRVPLVMGSGDVKRSAQKRRESIEEAARNLRYRFFGREAKRAGATSVAVGHTLDDRAETVLLHLIRGSGLDGLAAMPPRSPWPFGSGPEIARPLLELTRADIERYCAELGIEPRRDPTNDLPIATRNRVRNELLPILRSFNPKASEAMARLADAVAADTTYLDSLAAAESRRLAKVTPRAVTVFRSELMELPPPIAVRILRRAAGHIGAQPEAVHLENALTGLKKGRSRLSIPGGMIEIDPINVTVARRAAARARTSILPNKLAIPGRARVGGWTLEATKVERDASRPRDAFSALLDVDAIDGPLLVRSRKPGDRLRPFGLNGSKKLQDILVDAKVPQKDRDSIPVISDRLGIVWVAGHCIDQRVAVSAKTRRVLRLRARKGASR